MSVAGSAMASTAGYCAEKLVAGESGSAAGMVEAAIGGATGALVGTVIGEVAPKIVSGVKNALSSGSKAISGASSGGKTYQTYTKTNPVTGEVYSGRTSGYGTPEQNVARRDAHHHMNAKGFGPAVLDKSSNNYDAIRGREQQLIDMYGGAKSTGGTSGNTIKGISSNNPKYDTYMNACNQEFN